MLLGIVGIETLLRGALHGHLLRFYPVMPSSGRLFISVPNAVSAVVYSGAVTVCLLPPAWLTTDIGGWWMGWAGAALIFGLVCGGVRERSRSVWAAGHPPRRLGDHRVDRAHEISLKSPHRPPNFIAKTLRR